MKISYDKKADAVNITFAKGAYRISKEVAEGIIVDYSKEGNVTRIELLDVSKRMPKKAIKESAAGMR